MKILTHQTFDKHFKKRIFPNPKLISRFEKKVSLFTQNPSDPILKDHALYGGHIDHRAFWITGDIRVIYERVDDNTVRLLDIGTHNQVY